MLLSKRQRRYFLYAELVRHKEIDNNAGEDC